ncbi:MAG: serine/threonine-protein phosphatase [Clostridiales bacterium]|nr:serine/threonine-protein phosphatase [Clostridiales bacterium]
MYDVKKLNGTKTENTDRLKYFGFAFLRQSIWAVAGFFGAVADVGGLAPFGSALAAGVYPDYVAACVLGSSVGYFTMYGISALTLRYIASAAVAGILSYFFKRGIKRSYHRYFSGIFGFASVFSTGLVMSISVSLSIYESVLYLIEGIIAGAGGYFTDRALNISPAKRYAAELSGGETAGVLMAFGIVILGIMHFDFGIFSPAMTASTYAVLAAAAFGGEKYGCIVGICAGVVMGFSKGEGFVTGGMALGGLLCGIFGKGNRFISAVIYVITLCVAAFSADSWDAAGYIVLGGVVGAFAFILTPKKIRKRIKDVFSLSDDGAFLSGQRAALKMRLRAASDGMEDVSGTIKGIAGIYRRRSAPSKNDIYENVSSGVCSECGKYGVCRNRERYFERIVNAYKRSDNPDEEGIPYGFFTSCDEPERVTAALAAELEKYRIAVSEAVKTGETVNIVSDQFSSVSGFLNNFSDTMDSGEEYQANLSEIVRNRLEKAFGSDVVSVGVFRNENDKIFAEIAFSGSDRKRDYEEISEIISEMTDLKLDKPEIRELADGTVFFTVCERTRYTVEYGGCQISSDGKVCGDTFDSFYDGKGGFTMILSDGMGTGKSAAEDSVVCCTLASKLLRSGFPLESVIKMINSAMLLRSGEESLATLDIAKIDLYTGEVVFFKAGASFSVFMKHNRLMKAEKPSLPVGILRDVAFEKIESIIGDRDCVVLMSDGVTPQTTLMWKEILRDAEDYEGNELADKLAKTAVLNSGKEKADDITVITAALTARV